MADFAIIMGAALVGGLVAYRLRLPVLLGYLAAGILIGPYSFGLVKNVDLIETMASIGVVLLLFTLGMEFSLGDLKRVGKIGLAGGIIQITVTALLGFVISKTLLSWPVTDAIFFGFLIALSSTMVVLKILVERGETNTPHGRIMIAILLMQDLAVLPLMVILPALGQQDIGFISSLGITLGKVILFLGVMTLAGTVSNYYSSHMPGGCLWHFLLWGVSCFWCLRCRYAGQPLSLRPPGTGRHYSTAKRLCRSLLCIAGHAGQPTLYS